MYKVYGDYQSGNCYKVKLMLSLLDRPYEWHSVDILKGETETPEFLAMNPNGKVPVLQLEDGTCLWESNAILNFLADGSEFLPSEPRLRTQVLQWQFFEQYSHEPYIAVARFIQFYLGLPDERIEEYRKLHKGGYKALKVMERQLQMTPYLVGDQYSIADVALYAYTHVAHQGGFDLADYPAVRAWLERVASHPRHVPLADRSCTGLFAGKPAPTGAPPFSDPVAYLWERVYPRKGLKISIRLPRSVCPGKR